MGITAGEPWGVPESRPPDLVVSGSDGDLADALVGSRPGVLVAFSPSQESDIAKAVGLQAGAPRQGIALPMDALELADGALAVNAVVLGVPPDMLTWRHRSCRINMRLDGHHMGLDVRNATTVVIAVGQHLRGLDVVPRGHPGDGKADVHLFRIGRRERKGMRIRLPTGAHLPHQAIVTRTATLIDIRAKRELPLEIDGRDAPRTATLRVALVPARYRLLV